MDENRIFLEQFIDCYRTKRCLWDYGSQEYLSKDSKRKAYDDMLKIMKMYKANADTADVKKKINILRSSYRRELKKIKMSETSGERSETVYEPNLWWFHKLDFLRNVEKPSENTLTTSKMCPSVIEEETESFQDSLFPRKKPRRSDASREMALRYYEYPRTHGDEYDHFSKAWAAKLRQMEWTQSLIAERVINEIIYQGQRGYLSDDTMFRICEFPTNVYSSSTTAPPERKEHYCRPKVISNEEGDFIQVKSECVQELDNDFPLHSSNEAISSNSTYMDAACLDKPPTLRPIRTPVPNNNITSSRTESLLEQFFKD